MNNMKFCPKCGETRAVAEFSKNACKRDGLQGYCKECQIARRAVPENREKANAYAAIYYAEYYAANADKIKAKAVADYAESIDKRKKKKTYATTYNAVAVNREKATARAATYYVENTDSIKARNAAYKAANPEGPRIRKHNRLARERENGGVLSKGLSAKLFALQRGTCTCGCKQPLGKNFHLDHIMPIALGGMNVDSNIQLLRAKCNMQKSAKHPISFMQQRGFLI